ncbi:MAG: UDP-N-acetylmuramate--L-alanine ligase [Elusimicrobia bacterium]|nr:UDP-N-acetylmuramate--L-alanine ligase [Elusimicrobiota bacterium]
MAKRVHFVGIGGVGMSGIAEILLNLGYRVSGSDLKWTEVTQRLASLKARIYRGHRASQVLGVDVVVVSSAVGGNNPEVREAKRRAIPVVRRVEMLAELAHLKKTVAVSGSHGKTTTTSMAAMALEAAGAAPTMVIGGRLKNIRSNARLGSGKYLVAELDESDGSILKLEPLVSIVTNIDNDHMDYYGTMENLKKAFLTHLSGVPFYGAAVLCAEDPVLRSLFSKITAPKITYGFGSGVDWRPRNIAMDSEGARFDLYHRKKRRGSVRLKVVGRHNVLNATAAMACGDFLGFDFKRLAQGLSNFRGVGRRMEKIGEPGGVLLMDDYGHHPTEIRATLAALSKFWKRKRLIVVFQPHRFTRTKLLHREFGAAFKAADRVYVMPIYPAGEKPIPGVSSDLILKSLRRSGVNAFPFTRTLELYRDLRPGDIVLTQGAGDVWRVGEDLKRRLSA